MNEEAVIEVYEAIEGLSQRMLEAAKNHEWDELIALDEKRLILLDNLKLSEPGRGVETQLDARKSDLIQRILKDDAETKALTEAWMVELRELLDSISTEKKLNDAYTGIE